MEAGNLSGTRTATRGSTGTLPHGKKRGRSRGRRGRGRESEPRLPRNCHFFSTFVVQRKAPNHDVKHFKT